MKNLIKVFFNKSFFPFYISQFLGTFNDNFFRTALATFVMLGAIPFAENTRILITSLLITIFMLPYFLFSATSGEISDKYRKDVVMKIVKGLQFLLAFVALLGFLLQNIWILLAVLFFMGLLSTIFSTAKYSAVPELLEHDNLIAGNSLIQCGMYVSMLLGIICGALVYLVNVKWLYIIFFAVSLIGFISSLFIPQLKSASQSFQISFNFIKTAWKNMSYFKHSRDIYLCIIGISWFWFMGVVLISQIPNSSYILLQGQQSIYIFLITLFAAGVVTGSLLSYFLLGKDVSIRHIPISIVLMTIFIIDLSVAANKISLTSTNMIMSGFVSTFAGKRIIFDLFAFSVFAGLYIVPLVTMLQVLASRKIRARVMATNNVVNILAMLLATLICSAFLEAKLTLPAILTFIALFNVAVCLYVCYVLPAHLLRIITKRFMNLFYKIEVVGMENFQKCKGGTLIIANHTSLIDGIILSITFGEKLSFAINTEVTKNFWVKPFLKMIKFFPVDNTNVMVVKSIIDEIKKGGMVVIFPEGRITTTGGLMKVYPGPAVIADKSKADILPICIEGIQYSDFSYFGAKTKSRKQRKIKLTVLPPRKLDINEALPDSKRRANSMTKLYDIMCEMKFASNFTNKTIFDSLIQNLSLVGRKKEILDDIKRQPITVGSLLGAIFAFANKIRKQTAKKEYVGIMMANTKTTVEIFFALSATDRIPVMINYTEDTDNIVSCMENVGVKTVYTSKSFIREFKPNNIIEAFIEHNINVVYEEDLKDSINIFNKVSAYTKSHFPNYFYKQICDNFDSESPAVVLFTGSINGKSKSVVLTHKNIQASMAQLSSVMDFGIMDSFFNSMPIFSSLGFVAGTLLPLLRAIKLFMYHSPLHYKTVSELVYDTNSTVILGTDTFLAGYAKTAHPYDFYSIRYVISGIEKLKEETVKIWEDNFGKRIFEAYGTTETSSTISINTPMYFREKSVGRMLPGIECKLESTTAFVGASHLLVKGPNISDYYIENKQLISKKAQDNWFDTGDIVEIDKDKFIFMKGKSKRFIKVEGEAVSLTELEVKISEIWKDSKHALIKTQHNRKKEIILFTTYKGATKEELIKFVNENKVEDFIVPDEIIVMENIPITGTGTVDYLKLQETFKGLNK